MKKDKAALFNAVVRAGLEINSRDTRGYTEPHVDAAVRAGYTADLIVLMGGSDRLSHLIAGVKVSPAHLDSLYDIPMHSALLVALVGGSWRVCEHIESRPATISRRLVRGRQSNMDA